MSKETVQDSHPAQYFSVQAHRDQMPLRLPVIHFEGCVLHCDLAKLELQGLSLRVMQEFIARNGRLPHVVLLQLVERLAAASGSADRQARRVIRRLRILCARAFASTHPQLHWLPTRGRSEEWLLLRLKERYVLSHMHERGRVANLFHRHQFHYEPISLT